MTTMTSHARPQRPVGELLREWRERRRLSQLDLSIQADISTRHLSFVETGRSHPRPAMIIRLTEQLDVPLRERNTLLLAAGYAPAYPQHGLDEPELSSVRAALRQVLAGHQPYPAVVIDRWWEMLDSNAGVSLLVDGCAPWLLEPPVNVLRLSLHPDGMAPRILNLAQWRLHLLTQLQHRSQALGDERLRSCTASCWATRTGATASFRLTVQQRLLVTDRLPASCCPCATCTTSASSRSSRSAPASAPRPT
jgi:transcriptional regulator with XRE-family HTH domain